MRRHLRHPLTAMLALFLLVFLLLAASSPALGEAEENHSEIGANEPILDIGAVSPPRQEPDPDAIQRLIDDSGGTAVVSLNSATGAASFVRLPQGVQLPSTLSARASVNARANDFLMQYGGAFGITNTVTELKYVDSRVDAYGNTQVIYQQVYQGVDVFAGVLKVHFNESNQITAVNGTFVPKIGVRSTPELSADTAGRIAVDAVAGPIVQRNASHDLRAVNNQLYVYASGLAQGVAGPVHLVYEVEVTNSALTVREFVYVDAHSGAIVDRISGIHEGLNRQVSESSLANVVWVEGDPFPTGNVDWDNEIDGAGETYNLFASMAGRDSYDGAGATMRTVNNDPTINCPNANWNGTSTNYCTDVTGDDTVAHEWGHAYTEYTNNLIYQWQSGALNESYSDIWGEVVDLINGRDIDTPDVVRASNVCSSNVAGANFPGNPTVDTVRWLSGESDPAFFGIPAGSGNAIRDMWDPTCFGDPGKVTDTAQYVCTTADGGGVHTNSGIPNHGFALMVDGGTYNGQTITGLGLTKAAHIHWAAQNMLTPASNFADHADALEASCSALIGVNLNALSTSSDAQAPSDQVISAADCAEVAKVNAAVEFRTEPTFCGFTTLLDPAAPALCQGLGSVETINLQDWESGLGGWTVGTRDVANPATFDTPDWAVMGSLPNGRSGQAAFVADLVTGNCADDDESGVLFLESPVISIPASAEVPRVAFDHWVATELGWDGGNLKVSVNGGPWTLVPASAYDFNPYNQNLSSAGAGNTNPLAGQSAFTGTDGGSNNGTWGQSQVNLLGLAFSGDDVRFRYEFGVDGCNGVIGWYVDDVQTYSCSAEAGPVCGNSVMEAGETCDDGNASNGDGCSMTCQVESGWSCTAPVPPTTGTNVVADGSFEAGSPNPSWTEFSTNFGSPLCTQGGCGGPAPTDGIWFSWFGGVSVYEAGSLAQSLTIPATATDLEFDLLVGRCDSSDDYMDVTIDGNTVFSTDPCTPDAAYATRSVPIGAYADGGSHDLAFTSEIFATNGANSNFFLDNVVISDNVVSGGSPSQCTMLATELACNGGLVAFETGIPPLWTVVDNESSGVVWTDIAGSGEPGNYTGGGGDAATVSSDAFGPAEFNTELRSNPFDLSMATSASLEYLVNYQNFAALDFLDLDISMDGGSTWTTLLSWNEDHGGFRAPPGEAVTIDLSPYLGMSNLILRWHYYDPNSGDWDWYAQVDNVSLACEISLVPLCQGVPATIYVEDGRIVGGPHDGKRYRGTLLGTSGSDVIVGTGDRDVIKAFGGNDLVCGGDGNDFIYGLLGKNKLYGQGGHDTIFGGLRTDIIYGGSGNDLIDGLSGADEIYGEDGLDLILGGLGADQINGGNDDDWLFGNAQNDALNGGAGNDVCHGGSGQDTAEACEVVHQIP